MTSLGVTTYYQRTGSAAVRVHLSTATPFALAFATGAINVLAFQNLERSFITDPTGGPAVVVPEILGTVTGGGVAALAFAASLFAGLHGTALRWVVPAMAGALVVTWTSVMALDVGIWLLVIALSAATLALQAAGARRITDSAGGPAAWTSLGGDRQDRAWTRIGSIPALLVGAMLGMAITAAAPVIGPIVTDVSTIAAVVLVRRLDLHRD